MKKVLLCLACVGIIINLSAQDLPKEEASFTKHEMYAGFGFLNDNQMIAMVSDVVGAVITAGYLVQPDSYRAFTPFMGYRHWFTKHFGLGGILAFDYNSLKVYNGDPNSSGRTPRPLEMRKVNRYYMTFAIEPVFNYVYKPAFQLYGYVGLGGTVVTFSSVKFDDGSKPDISRLPFINAHVTPLGIRFGKGFGGFAEIGYGYKGILNAGISCRF